ncbi:MAG: CsbD family protein [Janthinobacterium lividum]
MSKDSDPGVSKEVSGSLKEAIGKITGDTETQVDGAAEKKAGKSQKKKPAKMAKKTK